MLDTRVVDVSSQEGLVETHDEKPKTKTIIDLKDRLII